VSVGSLISDIEFLSKATSEKSSIDAQIEQAKTIKSKINAKLEQCHQHHDFFEDHATCPSCSQDISEEHKSKVISDLNTKIDENNLRIEELESILGKLTLDLDNINNVQNQITQKNIELSTMNNKITLLNRMNSNLQTEIDLFKADTTNVDEEKRKLKDLAKEAIGKIEQKTSLQEQRNLEEVANILLKDTGIKTAIIREYLPVMNKLINKYLQAMDAYIHFELDEAFNEHVKSRFRDDFTYASFSEGEKMRIDLSILFTWRQIAKMKNSVNTNLLLLDEIFDSSLDTAGTDYFLNLMNQFGENTNIFVISHKGDQLFDKFRSVIKFEKRNDFSVIATP
jgi:DNA repair exonuclease SbcCD ATPase subunit